MSTKRQIERLSGIVTKRRIVTRQLDDLDYLEWSLIDELLSELEAPIEEEMRQILEEQEEEISRKVASITKDDDAIIGLDVFLSLLLIFDASYWLMTTVNRLAAYTRRTINAGFEFGRAQAGLDPKGDKIRESYVQEAIQKLAALNYRITETTEREVGRLVDDAIASRQTVGQFKTEFHSLFTKWKVYRPHGVSVFNVTYPFNNGLFRSYEQAKIPFKQWMSQRDSKVRPSHVSADGQIQPLHEKFSVGKAKLLHPGDLTQIEKNPEELHGCRCAIRPILDPAGAPD